MQPHLLPPKIEGNKQAKDLIISILITDSPLYVKKLYYALKSRYAFSGTYQAVFKAVKELEQQKILSRQNNEYEINLDWIKELRKFCDSIETLRTTKSFPHSADNLIDSRITILTFNSLLELDIYITDATNKLGEGVTTGNFLLKMRHFWWPILYTNYTESLIFKNLAQRSVRAMGMCSGNTALDRKIVKIYKILKADMSIKKFQNDSDILIIGQEALQVFYPHKFIKNMDKFFAAHTRINEKSKNKFIKELYESQTKIIAAINKNDLIAQTLYQQIIKQNESTYFKSAR